MAGLFKVIKSAVTGSEGAPFELVAKHQHFEERSYPAAKWVCTKRKGRSRQEVQKDMFMTLYGYISGKNEGNAKIEMTVPVTVTYVQCEEEPEPAAKENGESEQNGTAEAAEEPKKEEAAAEEKKEEPKENGDKEEEEKKEGDAAADEKKEEGKKEGDATTTNGQDGGNKAGKEKKDKKAKSKEKEKPAGPLKEYTMGFYIPKVHQESPPKPSDPDVFIEERPAMTIVTRTFGGYAKESQWENERQGLAQEVENTPGDLTVDPASFFTAGYDPPFKPLFRRNEVWLVKTGGSVAPPPEPEKPAEKQEETAKGKEENGKPKEEEKKENGEEKKEEEEEKKEEQAEGEGEKKKDEE